MNTMPTAKSLCQAGTLAFLVDRRKPIASDTSGGHRERGHRDHRGWRRRTRDALGRHHWHDRALDLGKPSAAISSNTRISSLLHMASLTLSHVTDCKPRSAADQVALLNIIGHRPCPPYQRQHISVCAG
ncbi:unnamed protein product [Gadus morhua 'NCC']